MVADCSLISAEAITRLDEHKLEHVLGARERGEAVMRKAVLANEEPFVPLFAERDTAHAQPSAKQVKADGRRYMVCRDEAEAEEDRAEGEAIFLGLVRQLENSDGALTGNPAYRRFLRKTATVKGKPPFDSCANEALGLLFH